MGFNSGFKGLISCVTGVPQVQSCRHKRNVNSIQVAATVRLQNRWVRPFLKTILQSIKWWGLKMETDSSSLHFLYFSHPLIVFLSRFNKLRFINHLLPQLYTTQYDETILKILQIVIPTDYRHISTGYIPTCAFRKSPFSLYCKGTLVCAMQV